MSLFRKFFGQGNDASNEEKNQAEAENQYQVDSSTPPDERFTFNFKKNGGKFLYCG